jgi:hypothetical protein
MDEGTAVGDENVAVVDFTGDPEQVTVTRGVGENSHVITVRLSVSGPPPPDPPVLGWCSPIDEVLTDPAHANTGTVNFNDYDSGLGHQFLNVIYGGIVGYVSGTVVWTPTWYPVASDPAPVLTPLANGRFSVEWSVLFPPAGTSEGLLVVSCTLDGVGDAGTIEASGSSGGYATIAWGPTP